MKKRIILFILSILIMSTLGSCKKQIEEPNTEEPNINSSKFNGAFIDTIRDTGIENLALVVNMPDETFLSTIKHLETYGEEDIQESFVMIPMYNGTKVQLITLEYENDSLIPKETVYEKSSSEEGYGLYVKTIRPEGAPHLKLRLEYEGRAAEYIITYNGKDGTPQYEYISLTQAGQQEDDEQEIDIEEDIEKDIEEDIEKDIEEDIDDLESELILPIQGNDYAENFNLIDSKKWDIDGDGNSEIIEVYSSTGMNEEGMLILDDGQYWSIVLKKGDKVYPLFERSYVQLGDVSYHLCESYVDNKYHILVTCECNKGVSIYDYTYDKNTDELRRKTVYHQELMFYIFGFHVDDYL